MWTLLASITFGFFAFMIGQGIGTLTFGIMVGLAAFFAIPFYMLEKIYIKTDKENKKEKI